MAQANPINSEYSLPRPEAQAKKRFKVPVVQLLSGLSHRALKASDMQIHDAGPAEFLSLIEHAKFVCTNSFHGTSFALIYGRPFLSTAALLGRNTRLLHLLDRFDERNRIVSETTDFDKSFWDRIERPAIEKWKSCCSAVKMTGVAFLDNALQS